MKEFIPTPSKIEVPTAQIAMSENMLKEINEFCVQKLAQYNPNERLANHPYSTLLIIANQPAEVAMETGLILSSMYSNLKREINNQNVAGVADIISEIKEYFMDFLNKEEKDYFTQYVDKNAETIKDNSNKQKLKYLYSDDTRINFMTERKQIENHIAWLEYYLTGNEQFKPSV